MNDTPNPQPAAAPAGPPIAPNPSSGVDVAQYQAEIQRLQAERDQYAGTIEALRPYADEISWLAQKPENAEFVRNSRAAYEDSLKRRQSEVPAELRPLAEKVDKISGFVDELQQAQQRAAEEPRRKWLESAKTFCNDLMVKHPAELGRNVDPNFGWASALESFCSARGLSPEEGWKIIGPAFVKQSAPPPPSMRADSGITGLPPPRPEPIPDALKGKKLGDIVLERMHAIGTS